MPKFTFVQYEGDDEQIAQMVGRLISSEKAVKSPGEPSTTNGSSMWDTVSTRFERLVSSTAAEGRPSQKQAIVAWLRDGGEIELTKLWKAAGVKAQHDYSGVGGSLSKNMIKAGGPSDWYDAHVDGSGQWIYKLLPELVEPLKRAFSIR
jgi:hypothetical protein